MRCQATKVLGLTTVKASRQLNQRLSSTRRQAGRIVSTSGLDLALLIEGELLAQEQILGCERALERKPRHRKWTRSPRILNQLSPVPHDARGLSAVDAVSVKFRRTIRVSSQKRMFLRSTTASLTSRRTTSATPTTGSGAPTATTDRSIPGNRRLENRRARVRFHLLDIFTLLFVSWRYRSGSALMDLPLHADDGGYGREVRCDQRYQLHLQRPPADSEKHGRSYRSIVTG